MSEDMSNKTLTILVAIALILMLGSTVLFISKLRGENISARATTDQAQARLRITSLASINFTISSVDWGSGFVNETATYCQLDTEGGNNPSNCSNFTTVYEGLRLENDGNRNVQLNISANNTAAQFLGGTNPLYEWKLANNESDSCGSKGIGTNCVTNVSALQFQTYSTASNTPVDVCACFRPSDPSDLLNIELMVRVPSDSFSGLRDTTITAVATAI
ncbi:hypothetical protein ACFL3V_03175 [Nanoarchaeota archaeon]